MSTIRMRFVAKTLLAAVALSMGGAALADGCRDGQGRLVYCDDAGRDTQNCIDKRGFTVSCGLPGARYRNSRAARDNRIVVANRMAADVTVRSLIRGTPAEIPEQDLVSAGKRRAAAAKRGRAGANATQRGARSGEPAGN
ncbi:hypothetical protein [Sphingomonas sp. UYP23]